MPQKLEAGRKSLKELGAQTSQEEMPAGGGCGRGYEGTSFVSGEKTHKLDWVFVTGMKCCWVKLAKQRAGRCYWTRIKVDRGSERHLYSPQAAGERQSQLDLGGSRRGAIGDGSGKAVSRLG